MGLIGAALTVVVVAGLVWLRANGPAPAPAFPMPSPVATLSSDYQVGFDFVSPSAGWAVLTSYGPSFGMQVFRTADGARHWRRIYVGPGVAGTPGIHFVDGAHGFIWSVVSAFTMFRTSDAGNHWQEMSFPKPPASATFADATHGWFLSFASVVPNLTLELFATDDGGASWSERAWPLNPYPPDKAGVVVPGFRPNGEGWVGGFSTTPEVDSTSDGGVTWQMHVIPPPPNSEPSPAPGKGGVPLYSVTAQALPFSGVLAVVTFGQSEMAYTSFDSGLTWRLVTQPPDPVRYSDVTFLDSRHWWAFRFGFLFKTADAGLTWHETRVAPLLEGWNYSPAFVIDAGHAWSSMTAIRSSGRTLSMTTDGGASWHTVNVPQPG